jgi:preprotein translocase subunit SecF
MELFKSTTNFDFMAWRVPSLIISAILCVASLALSSSTAWTTAWTSKAAPWSK